MDCSRSSATACGSTAAAVSASTRSLTALAFGYRNGPSLRTAITPSGAAQSGWRSTRPQAPVAGLRASAPTDGRLSRAMT